VTKKLNNERVQRTPQNEQQPQFCIDNTREQQMLNALQFNSDRQGWGGGVSKGSKGFEGFNGSLDRLNVP